LEVPYYYLPGGKKPWYFQEVAIKRVIEEILKGKRRLLLTMATGTGKTYVAFQVVWKLVKSGYFRCVLYLADRLFLRNQAYNEFSAFGDARAIIEDKKEKGKPHFKTAMKTDSGKTVCPNRWKKTDS
jgi:type I restriction enzyme R subunit